MSVCQLFNLLHQTDHPLQLAQVGFFGTDMGRGEEWFPVLVSQAEIERSCGLVSLEGKLKEKRLMEISRAMMTHRAADLSFSFQFEVPSQQRQER
jgi:hypothetical protein